MHTKEETTMTNEEINKILQTSNADDWNHNASKGAFSYKKNLNVRIQENLDRNDDFDEPWVHNYPDSHAYKVNYDVYWNQSWVKTVTLVCVDGGRAIVPMPERSNSTRISTSDYKFAKIVSPDSLDEYIKRGKLTKKGNCKKAK